MIKFTLSRARYSVLKLRQMRGLVDCGVEKFTPEDFTTGWWMWTGRDPEHEQHVAALLRLKGITAEVIKWQI